MKARDFDPAKLDVEAFAKAGGSLEGTWPLRGLERFAASTVAAAESDRVAWRARGEHRVVRGGHPQIWLHIEAQASVMLECQRCLAPVAAQVDARRSFLFVHGENTAAELDSDSEDDVLAMTHSLDLPELVEDELLLALPLVPRHDVCPEPLVAQEPAEPLEEGVPHPFAALAALKRGGLPN
jgi:uncharacterized protein